MPGVFIFNPIHFCFVFDANIVVVGTTCNFAGPNPNMSDPPTCSCSKCVSTTSFGTVIPVIIECQRLIDTGYIKDLKTAYWTPKIVVSFCFLFQHFVLLHREDIVIDFTPLLLSNDDPSVRASPYLLNAATVLAPVMIGEDFILVEIDHRKKHLWIKDSNWPNGSVGKHHVATLKAFANRYNLTIPYVLSNDKGTRNGPQKSSVATSDLEMWTEMPTEYHCDCSNHAIQQMPVNEEGTRGKYLLSPFVFALLLFRSPMPNPLLIFR